MRRTLHRDERAQAFTLEALVAGLLIVVALLFALQSVVVAPGIPGSDIEPDVRQQATDTLDIAHREGDLNHMMRYFNDTTDEETFAGARSDDIGYGSDVPPTRFGDLIERSFTDRGMVVNVIVHYHSPTSTLVNSDRLVYRGAPPDAATVATSTVTLYSDQQLTGPDGDNRTLAAAAANGTYPIPDIDPDGPVHNVVEVRVIIW